MKNYILVEHNHVGAFCISNVIESEGELVKTSLYSVDGIYFDQHLNYKYRDIIKQICDKDIVYKYSGDPSSRFNREEDLKKVIEGSINKCNQANKLRKFMEENNIDENVNYIENILRMY